MSSRPARTNAPAIFSATGKAPGQGRVPVRVLAAAPAAGAVLGTPPNPHFEQIGGAAAIARLTELFYRHMDSLPEAKTIRALHPPDLSRSQQTLFKYLVGWMGGPPLYAAEHGHPRLRHKHLSFAIGDAERDAWMKCMQLALDEVVVDEAFRREIAAAFCKTATFLRNC
jgi:hemoglobin